VFRKLKDSVSLQFLMASAALSCASVSWSGRTSQRDLKRHYVTTRSPIATSNSYYTGHETIIPAGRRPGMARWREALFGFMHRNAQRPGAFQYSPRQDYGNRNRVRDLTCTRRSSRPLLPTLSVLPSIVASAHRVSWTRAVRLDPNEASPIERKSYIAVSSSPLGQKLGAGAPGSQAPACRSRILSQLSSLRHKSSRHLRNSTPS
jgi:hypothetical protein